MASPSSPSASKSPKTMTRSPRRGPGVSALEQPIGIRQAGSGRGGRPAARRTRPRGRPRRSRRGAASRPVIRSASPRPNAACARSGVTGPASGKLQRKRGSSTLLRMPRGASPRLCRPSRTRQGVGAAGLARAGRREAAVPSVVAELPVDEQRARDEDRRVGPDDDPDQQGEDEVADRRPAEQEQGEQRDQRR